MTITVAVNGEATTLTGAITVGQLVAARAKSGRGVAVALNGEVVPRSEWDTTVIPPGAAVEIVTAAAGG